MIHYVNLTRGLECPHLDTLPTPPRMLRIQSTWCEQKRWADILWTVGPDLYYHLAVGEVVTVHDLSEKPRQTRATWQGLSWIRAACQLAWDGRVQLPECSRGGMDLTGYWYQRWRALPERVHTHVEYFGRYRNQPYQVLLGGCGSMR